jgi:type I restriction enzyme R subunit
VTPYYRQVSSPLPGLDEIGSARWDDEMPPDAMVDADEAPYFNASCVDKVLNVLALQGLKVDERGVMGKTIIFAKSIAHAEFIARRLPVAFPGARDDFAQVFSHRTPYVRERLREFARIDMAPDPLRIAVGVDLPAHGIEAPAVLNLVLFRPIRSASKFWQILSRGSLPCADLHGAGKDKTRFLVIDAYKNVEHFAA